MEKDTFWLPYTHPQAHTPTHSPVHADTDTHTNFLKKRNLNHEPWLLFLHKMQKQLRKPQQTITCAHTKTLSIFEFFTCSLTNKTTWLTRAHMGLQSASWLYRGLANDFQSRAKEFLSLLTCWRSRLRFAPQKQPQTRNKLINGHGQLHSMQQKKHLARYGPQARTCQS